MSSDETVTLGAVKRAMGDFARARDWEQFHAPKNLAMAITAEAGELLEHLLWATPDASIVAMRDDGKRAKAAEELADIILTKAAEENNAENMLVIRSASLAAEYLDNWNKHREYSEPYAGR